MIWRSSFGPKSLPSSAHPVEHGTPWTLRTGSPRYGSKLDEIDLESGIKSLLGTHADRSFAILSLLLDVIRRNRAIKMPLGASADDEFLWGSYAQHDRVYSLSPLEDIRFRLIPAMRPNGTLYPNRWGEFLGKKLGLQNWQEFLGEFWKRLCDSDAGILIPFEAGHPGMVLDYRRLQFSLVDRESVFRCKDCALRPSPRSRGKMPAVWMRRCDDRNSGGDPGRRTKT